MNNRESSFELLRLIAQYMIVAYHILLFWFVLEGPNPQPIYKALWVPLHIGVPLFVMISGYFKIKLSIKGLAKLIAPVFIYGFGLYLLNHFIYDGEFKLSSIFFVSNTPYWFIRTYLFLYLLSPLINRVIKDMTLTIRIAVLIILTWISCWCGLMGFDASLHEGYNVLHFALLYLIGNTLAVYKDKCDSVPTWCVAVAYILLAIGSVVCAYCSLVYMPRLSILFHWLFEYNSLLLITQAVLFFMLFMRLHFYSRAVNYMASSSLAIYLIHHCDVIFRHGIKDCAMWIQSSAKTGGGQVALAFVLAMAIVLVCIGIDKCLVPLWNLVSRGADKLTQTKFGKIIEEYSYR